MASGRLIDYLGADLIANRDPTPDLHPNTLGIFYATDTDTLSIWDGTAWSDVVGSGTVNTVVAGTGIDVDSTDPANPEVALDSASVISLALADSSVQSVVAGTGVSVDNTDPQNPVVSAAVANRYINVALSDMTTDLTTGTAKAVWFAPEDGTLASVYIGVHDPSSSGVVRVDMNDSGGSVFTTRPAIDATEATSLTGTAAVLDGTVSFVRGDKFTFDIDDAGTDAKGLQVCIEYTPA